MLKQSKRNNHPMLLCSVAGIGILLICVLFFFSLNVPSSNLLAAAGSTHDPNPRSEHPLNKTQLTVSAGTESPPPDLRQPGAHNYKKSELSKLRPLIDHDEKVLFDFDKNLLNIGSLLTRSHSNDREASLAIALIGLRCAEVASLNTKYFSAREASTNLEQFELQRQKIQESCRNLPRSVLDARFEHLERAAFLGSKFALVEYMRALNETAQTDPAWLWRNVNDLPRLRAQAVEFAETAINQGIAEGYIQMYQAHAVNGFSPRDDLTALAYIELLAQGLSTVGVSGDKYLITQRRDNLLSKLSEAEIMQFPTRVSEIRSRIR